MLEYYRGKKILITGAGGYIGSTLIHQLSNCDCEITRLTSRKLPALTLKSARVLDVVTDWSDFSLIKELISKTEVIFHFRAQTSAYKAEENPQEDFLQSVKPLSLLLSAAHLTKNKPSIIIASTVTVYGLTPKNQSINETYSPMPATIYDIHKLTNESLIENFSKRGSIKGASVRLANVYGPGVASSVNDRGILNQIIKKTLSKQEITIFGDGEYLRDYVFIEDVVRAFLHIGAEAPKKGECYNVASGSSRTLINAIKEVAIFIKENTGIEMNYKFIPEPEYLLPIEKRDFTGDIKKLTTATTWNPQVNFVDGLKLTIRSFQ